MKRIMCLLPLIILFAILLCQCAGMSNLPIDSLVGPVTDKIIKKEPAITTSLEDAVTELPFLDDFDPQNFTPMVTLPRDSHNAFILHPGLFELHAQSYCLHAGKYVPGGGDGYVYAPLKGPYADIVQSILRNSVDHPEIPQRDIQTLIWAVIARTKVTEMPGKRQHTVAQLLEPEEILELNGGALGLIPGTLLQKAMAHLPPQVRQVMEAEARLRQMLTKTQATYEELEQIAAPFGDPHPGEGSRDVPGKRWSYHPDGYFIRFFPSGYSRTLIQMSVPERFYIVRDALGRITLIIDLNGNRIETEYDDSIEPVTMADDPDIRGYAFRSVRFVKAESTSPETISWLRAEWKNSGWTLVGVPSGTGQSGSPFERFSDLQQRYAWALTHKKQVQKLDGFFEVKGSLNDIMDLGHYALAINQVLSDERTEKAEWAVEHPALIKKAWQYAVCLREGGCDATEDMAVGSLPAKGKPAVNPPILLLASADPTMHIPARSSDELSENIAVPGSISWQQLAQSEQSIDPEFVATIPPSMKFYDPSENVAAPGNTSRQRLAESGVSWLPGSNEVSTPPCVTPEQLQCSARKQLAASDCHIQFQKDINAAEVAKKTCLDFLVPIVIGEHGLEPVDIVTAMDCHNLYDTAMSDAVWAAKLCLKEAGQCGCGGF